MSTDVAMISRHAEELSEHFDAVQIFATRHESGSLGGTVNVDVGSGNWFARYGQVIEWVEKQNERTRIKTRKDEQDQ